MKWLSLFSGIGGFDLAITRKGHEIIAACEIDKYARTIYARHFPNIPIYEDATKLTGEEFGEIDGICAGFPCQTFSLAGNRLGFEESRGTLFYEIARLAKQKRPRLLLLENVKGLLSHDRGKTFAIILATLDELGYDAQWQVLNSKYFVPQNRERIFIIGHLRGTSRPKVFPIREDGETINKERTIVRAITGGAHSGGLHSQMTGIVINEGKIEPKKNSTAIDANYYKGVDNHRQRTMVITNPEATQNYRIYDDEGISPTLSASCEDRNHKNTLVSVSAPVMLQHDGMNGRRIKNHNEPTFALTTSKNQSGIFNGKSIRRLTPKECERLQGFQDDYTVGISDTQRYKCLGNAVTVPVIEFILERLT